MIITTSFKSRVELELQRVYCISLTFNIAVTDNRSEIVFILTQIVKHYDKNWNAYAACKNQLIHSRRLIALSKLALIFYIRYGEVTSILPLLRDTEFWQKAKLMDT